MQNETLIYENGFDTDLGGFVKEGPGLCQIECGRLYMDDSQHKKGLTLWLDRQFEGGLHIMYESIVTEPELYGNVNLFFMAKTLDGLRVLDECHTGAYEEYHKTCRLYIATFVGGTMENANHHSRLRKDPGFNLLSENTNFFTRINEKYLIEVFVKGGDIEYRINGNTVHKVLDDKPYCSGSIGLRTWNSRIWVDNFKVYSF